MYHESMCRESMYCARTKSFSWRPDNESLCFEHDAPYAGISLREQLFITNIVLMPLQNRKRVLSYFADDVALKLDSCHVFYTPNVGIRGVSSYEHNFDFLFQRSANHPTRFCQAPNRFDKDAVKDIMFGWDDTKKDPKRRDSRLIVIGDDRQTPLQRGALTAFRNYGVPLSPTPNWKSGLPWNSPRSFRAI